MKRITVGRAPENDYVFDKPTISYYHADIVVDAGTVILTDHSRNGTWINGEKLNHASRRIQPGDTILLPEGVKLEWAMFVNGWKETKPLNDRGTQPLHDRATQPKQKPCAGADNAAYNNNGPHNNGFQRSDNEPRDGDNSPFDNILRNNSFPDIADGYRFRTERSLTIIEAVANVFNHYTDFSGRARRSEYWWFVLVNFIAMLIPYLGYVWMLAVLIPSLAVAVRRLHDIGKSGWYLLLGLIPLVGWIILIVWYCQDGTELINRHGFSPKYKPLKIRKHS